MNQSVYSDTNAGYIDNSTMTNLSLGGFSQHNNTTVAEVKDFDYRLQKFLSEPHQLLAVFLSVAAILLNVFSLLAISKVQQRMTTHFLFIISLALSDITIGVRRKQFMFYIAV